MLKKRTLLLGAALAAFGATAINGAFAFAPYVTTDASEDVDVIDPVNPVLDSVQTQTAIVANGAPQVVANLKHSTTDTNYSWNLTNLQITGGGSQVIATCGSWDYSLSGNIDDTGVISVPVPNVATSTGYDLRLAIPAAGTDATCKVSGATVQATFQIP